MDRSLLRRELPFMLLASLLFWLLALDHLISRYEGVVLLVGLAAFIYYCLRTGKQDPLEIPSIAGDVQKEKLV